MKKICILLAMILLLTGCASQDTFETLGDIDMTPVIQEEKTLSIQVEEEAQILKGEQGTLYLCDGYCVSVEVLSGGDLSGTFKSLTGFESADLTVMETSMSGFDRYETVWTAATDGGSMVGRAVVIDDGNFHYCVTFTADASDCAALQSQWDAILRSLTIL